MHSLAKQLCDLGVDAPEPYELLIEATNVDSYGKTVIHRYTFIQLLRPPYLTYVTPVTELYDEQLCEKYSEKFPDTGLSKLIQGQKLYKAGDGDAAFDLFAVSMV